MENTGHLSSDVVPSLIAHRSSAAKLCDTRRDAMMHACMEGEWYLGACAPTKMTFCVLDPKSPNPFCSLTPRGAWE